MGRFSIFTVLLVLALMVSACGVRVVPQVTPTINAIDLQGTVAAAAFTVVAETQAAIPTATLLPPTGTATNTPEPTNTFLPLPEVGATFTPLPGAGDPCLKTVLPASLEGEKIKIRIDNPTKAAITLSVNLQQSGAGSVCGYRIYTLTAGQTLVIGDLVEGCYSLWAWNPDPKNYFMVTNGTSCLDTSTNWTFDITTNGIRLRN